MIWMLMEGNKAKKINKLKIKLFIFIRNEIIDMDKNDLYIISYKPIGNYTNSEEIQLI